MPLFETLAVASLAASAVGAGMSFVSSQNQAAAMQQQSNYQAQLMQQQATMAQQQAQAQAMMMQQQAAMQASMLKQQSQMQAEMARAQAVATQNQYDMQATLQQRQGQMQADQRKLQARQQARAELRKAEGMMDQQRKRRSAIESAYAAAGVSMEGSPAELLAMQREVDRFNVEQVTYEGDEQRKQMYWVANSILQDSQAQAGATRYVGAVDAALLRAEAENRLTAADMEAAGIKYGAAADAAATSYAGKAKAYGLNTEAVATRFAGQTRASAMRSQAWGSLFSSAGNLAFQGASLYKPSPS